MSNIIDFLEKLGQDARLRHATRSELEQALADAEIAPADRTAIFLADQRDLESVVGARGIVCCMVAQPRFDDEDEENLKESPFKRAAVAS